MKSIYDLYLAPRDDGVNGSHGLGYEGSPGSWYTDLISWDNILD